MRPLEKSDQKASSLKVRLAYGAVLVAGAAWGVSFLAPHVLVDSDATTISLYRFLFFALFSVFSLFYRRNHLPKIEVIDLGRATLYSLLGYSFYYFLLSFSVKNAGAPFATLMIGLLPVTILLFAIPRFEFRHLFLPLMLVLSGILFIACESYSGPGIFDVSPLGRVLGMLSALAALGCWTIFSIQNSKFIQLKTEWSPLDWSSFIGFFSGVTAIILFICSHGLSALTVFCENFTTPVLLWTFFMGVVGAWGATGLWNYASRILPAATVGQLLVFESIFGLLFTFIYDKRMPTLFESLAILFLMSGAFLGVRAINRIMISVERDRH